MDYRGQLGKVKRSIKIEHVKGGFILTDTVPKLGKNYKGEDEMQSDPITSVYKDIDEMVKYIKWSLTIRVESENTEQETL